MEVGMLAVTGVPWASVALLVAGLAILLVVIVQTARANGWSGVLGPARVRPITPPAPARTEQAEVEELVRQLAPELDERAARLERLIADADDRLARLEGAGRAPARRAEPEGRAAARMVIREEGDPVTKRIYTLADDGMAAVEIARRVEQPTGKVELILALRGR